MQPILSCVSTPQVDASSDSNTCSYYGASGYLYAVPELIEPFAIVALFYFYVSVVTPHSTVREEFYSNLERQSGIFGTSKTKKIDSLRWFHVSHRKQQRY